MEQARQGRGQLGEHWAARGPGQALLCWWRSARRPHPADPPQLLLGGEAQQGGGRRLIVKVSAVAQYAPRQLQVRLQHLRGRPSGGQAGRTRRQGAPAEATAACSHAHKALLPLAPAHLRQTHARHRRRAQPVRHSRRQKALLAVSTAGIHRAEPRHGACTREGGRRKVDPPRASIDWQAGGQPLRSAGTHLCRRHPRRWAAAGSGPAPPAGAGCCRGSRAGA